MLFEKRSRKLHSFFLFLLYDILVKKSIIEEGVCIMAKILIVDDEPRIRELIREHLQYSGYICEEAADGTAALTQLSGGAFDLVILDLMMPFMDGMTCLREMRARHINTPVIILTARSEEYDKLAGLEGGADDYVVKPFDAKEIVARIKAVMRRTGKASAGSDVKEVSYDKLVVNMTRYELKVNGTEDAAAWSSSAPTVASVNSAGEVTALTKGNAVITAEVNGESVTCTVTVKESKTILDLIPGVNG